ncbi:MAG: peptide-methionine (R)-S-oxide reductase MsrB [Anaerolineaceae bacterium]|nr:peptide-methionine (R)-S-oxide reductase MsrB [Anaerolineaceae bacterium]
MVKKQNTGLTPEQEAVLFKKATEPAFTGSYLRHHADGTYICANCGARLFISERKYDSHCGWPSFDQCIEGAIEYIEDHSFGMKRIEVVCAACGGHLGHVFPDGPSETTGQRYCINSLSLEFKAEK